MRVYIIRHGESENNIRKLWTGWMDVHLTEKGREQAKNAGKLLADVRFDKIYSSDLIRARETAECMLPGCRYETSELLREYNVGSIAGRPYSSMTQEDWASTKDGYTAFGGESRAQFTERVEKFVHILEESDASETAVFCHAGWLRGMLDYVLKGTRASEKVCCSNCTVGIFEYTGGRWLLHSWINPR